MGKRNQTGIAWCDAMRCYEMPMNMHAFCMCNSFNFNSSIVIKYVLCIISHWSVYIIPNWKKMNAHGRASGYDFFQKLCEYSVEFMHDYPTLNTIQQVFHISIYGNFRCRHNRVRARKNAVFLLCRSFHILSESAQHCSLQNQTVNSHSRTE